MRNVTLTQIQIKNNVEVLKIKQRQKSKNACKLKPKTSNNKHRQQNPKLECIDNSIEKVSNFHSWRKNR